MGHTDHTPDMGVTIATLDGGGQVPSNQLGNVASAGPPASDYIPRTGTSGTGTSILIPFMTVTPPAGTYMFTFTGTGVMNSNNSEASIFIGDPNQLSGSLRIVEGSKNTSFTCRAKVTVNGSQTITARFTTIATLTLLEHSFDYIEVAA